MKLGSCVSLFGLVLSLSMNVVARELSPQVLGKGKGLFRIGERIVQDDFENLDSWVVQLQEREGKAWVKAQDKVLDCFVPDRGCTVWFKEKLKTRVTITYDVLCPISKDGGKGLQPSDLNHFWMASDPEAKLFDSARFSGKFGDYDVMHGYYASSGGGRNTTTRMRRYPRKVKAEPVEHLALTERDGQSDFLITPEKLMTVQLVAYDDVIQYIVDGRLVYETSAGDKIQVERRDDQGKRVLADSVYDLKSFPVYDEGYFGFRMVSTHHIYSNFQVHELLSEEKGAAIEVSSIKELRATLSQSDQRVVMKPGVYRVEDLQDRSAAFRFSGSNNDFDLTGVTIEMPIRVVQQMSLSRRRERASYLISGDHVTLKGGTFENVYPDGRTQVTDFGSYNQDSKNAPYRSVTEMKVTGDDVLLIGCRMIVRGSYPYGYGNMYGIGGGAVVGLKKHSGILLTGKRNVIDGCYVKMEAFGHAIFVQKGGDDILVKNTEVVGEVRRSNGLYEEKGKRDLPRMFNYQIQWPEDLRGVAIPRDHMVNLVEDGIRAYSGTGHMRVENCKVSRCRGGIKLYMAKSAEISNCEVIDCVVQGFSIPNRGTIQNCKGNAAYGPLLYIHSDGATSQRIDLEVLPAPHSLGDHPLAAIKGGDHRISLKSGGDEAADQLRPIIVGYSLRFDFLSVVHPEVPAGLERNFEKFAPESYRASRIRLENFTKHPVILGEHSLENRVISRGKVRNQGTRNEVKSGT